jgi:hypothetical protein
MEHPSKKRGLNVGVPNQEMHFAANAEEQKKTVQMGNVVADDENGAVCGDGSGADDLEAVEKLI